MTSIPLQSMGGSNGPRRSDASDTSKEISPDEATKLWEDLKAETGYTSYHHYLRAYEKGRPEISKLLRDLPYWCFDAWAYPSGSNPTIDAPFLPTRNSSCTVLDISLDENSRPRVGDCCTTSSATKLLAVLRRPPGHAAARIVLWDAVSDNKGMLSAVGLALRIGHHYFVDLVARSRGDSFPTTFARSKFLAPLLHPNYIILGGTAVYVSRRLMSEGPEAIPVLLITDFQQQLRPYNATAQSTEVLPFEHPAVEAEKPSPTPNQQPRWVQDYIRLLCWSFGGELGTAGASEFSLLQMFLPLTSMNIFTIRGELEHARNAYFELLSLESYFRVVDRDKRKSVRHSLYERRLRLRREAERSEEEFGFLLRFVRSLNIADWQKDGAFLKTKDDLEKASREAHNLDVEIRDYLQILFGDWSLQESRKSIELSNLQIEEGKRGQ